MAADAAASGYNDVPPQSAWQLTRGAAYLHYTPNETIGGVEFPFIPHSRCAAGGGHVLDTSCRGRSMSARFGLIYAGAQKNIGPSGLVVVIVREDLLGRARPDTPRSGITRPWPPRARCCNTPPTFAWYMAGLVFKWLKRQGGLAAMGERNRAKAELLYGTIDESGFYRNPVDAPAARG